MTIHELHKLFYVEYDKANSITTYPNFTHAEIDIWLNKALIMIINQRFTGNNVRKVGFEGDSKRISDLQKIVITTDLTKVSQDTNISNASQYTLPSDFMLYIGSYLSISNKKYPSDLIEHEYIKLFTSTTYNSPWIKRPKVAIENNKILAIYDASVSYNNVSTLSLNYIKFPDKIVYGDTDSAFQFNDSIAEDTINLAILLALGNIESNKIQIVGETIKLEE